MAKRSLLLVDGDAKSLRVLEVSLKKAGFNLVTATNGLQALEKASDYPPDLVISDTDLPEMDGYEFCRSFKENSEWADIPFIFLTKQTTIEDKIKGLELGVDDYLTKPIYIKEILTRVRILLQKHDRASLEQKKEHNTRFAGQLNDMGVVDLIQTIEVSRKTGIIYFQAGEKRQATIFFKDGKVIDAEAGQLTGEEAVYRILTWNEGEFEAIFRPVRRKSVIEMSSQSLLMEGMRRLDEWGRLQEQLPPLDHAYEIVYEELWERLSELPDDLNEILRLFDTRKTLSEVIDSSSIGDLEVVEIISKLYFEGIISEVGSSGVAQGSDKESEEETTDSDEVPENSLSNPQPSPLESAEQEVFTPYGDQSSPLDKAAQNADEPADIKVATPDSSPSTETDFSSVVPSESVKEPASEETTSKVNALDSDAVEEWADTDEQVPLSTEDSTSPLPLLGSSDVLENAISAATPVITPAPASKSVVAQLKLNKRTTIEILAENLAKSNAAAKREAEQRAAEASAKEESLQDEASEESANSSLEIVEEQPEGDVVSGTTTYSDEEGRSTMEEIVTTSSEEVDEVESAPPEDEETVSTLSTPTEAKQQTPENLQTKERGIPLWIGALAIAAAVLAFFVVRQSGAKKVAETEQRADAAVLATELAGANEAEKGQGNVEDPDLEDPDTGEVPNEVEDKTPGLPSVDSTPPTQPPKIPAQPIKPADSNTPEKSLTSEEERLREIAVQKAIRSAKQAKRSGDRFEALQLIDESLNLRKSSTALLFKAELLMDIGDTAAATSLVEELTRVASRRPAVWRLKGNLLKTKGDSAGAKTAYLRYLKMAPTAKDASAIRTTLSSL